LAKRIGISIQFSELRRMNCFRYRSGKLGSGGLLVCIIPTLS
jgi:hypothetical protein